MLCFHTTALRRRISTLAVRKGLVRSGSEPALQGMTESERVAALSPKNQSHYVERAAIIHGSISNKEGVGCDRLIIV